jgi:hypothetical protein
MNRCAMVAKLERSRQTPPSRFLTTPNIHFELFRAVSFAGADQVDLIR